MIKNVRTCYHAWERYEGLFEVFTYCDKCGLKHSDLNDIWDDKFLEEMYPEAWKAIVESKKPKEPAVNKDAETTEYIKPSTTRNPAPSDLDDFWFD